MLVITSLINKRKINHDSIKNFKFIEKK